jgi:hypothetical protein
LVSRLAEQGEDTGGVELKIGFADVEYAGTQAKVWADRPADAGIALTGKNGGKRFVAVGGANRRESWLLLILSRPPSGREGRLGSRPP